MKIMKKFIYLFLPILLFFNCSSLVKENTSVEIKNLALVTMYVNNNVVNLEKSYQDIDLDLVNSLALKDITPESKIQFDKIVNEFFQLFINQWNQGKSEKLIDLQDYVTNPKYINFGVAKKDPFDFEDEGALIEKYFSSPKRINIIPLQRIVKNNNQEDLLGKTINYGDLVDLAQELKVDGVLLIKNQLAFEQRGNGFYSSIGFQILLINKLGEEVVNTDFLNRRSGLWFRGKRITLDEEKKIEDTNENIKVILDTYKKGIDYLMKKINFTAN